VPSGENTAGAQADGEEIHGSRAKANNVLCLFPASHGLSNASIGMFERGNFPLGCSLPPSKVSNQALPVGLWLWIVSNYQQHGLRVPRIAPLVPPKCGNE
jgi:hypothetical protein